MNDDYEDYLGDYADSDKDEKRALHEAKLNAAIKTLMKTPDGVHFLRWLVHASGTLEATYTDGIERAAFREGKRTIGAAVLALIIGNGGAEKFFSEDIRNG